MIGLRARPGQGERLETGRSGTRPQDTCRAARLVWSDRSTYRARHDWLAMLALTGLCHVAWVGHALAGPIGACASLGIVVCLVLRQLSRATDRVPLSG